MRKLGLSKIVCIVFVFCAAAVIAAPAQTLTTLVNFAGIDGANAQTSLIQATDGNFYGTTVDGGANGHGTVFEITPGGMLTTLYNFCAQTGCTDGSYPEAGLVQGADGNFYGTTLQGGANKHGTVFKITPTGTLTLLHSFNDADGYFPYAGLVQATDGNFYGTTYYGGANYSGTVFKITPAGTLTTLYSFCAQADCTDGDEPKAGLVQGVDGNFYGTTQYGGANEEGTVFKITPEGTLTILYRFCSQMDCTDGSFPSAGLVQGVDGNFYGTTAGDGANDQGTVFKVTPAGTLTTLHNFTGYPTDGALSTAALVQATDGNFYGTTAYGGANDAGTVFKITPTGKLTLLRSFNGADGYFPYAGLVQATDGNFYGTTYEGGANGTGTVFRLSVGPWQFVPVTPCRLVDTRDPNGEFGGPPLQESKVRGFTIPDNQQCNIPAAAAAYSLNVTVVPPPHGTLGYLTAWPTGEDQPKVSTLNSDGRVKANAAIVPAGTSGGVSFYVTATTDLILDIDGYFTSPSWQTLQFYPLAACRVADTRDPSEPRGLGPPSLSALQPRDFPVLLATSCFPKGVTPAAYSFNVTAVPKGPLGYLTVWPAGDKQPFVSTLNAPTGTVTANAAIVRAGTGGVSAYASNNTDLIIDINGYFASPGEGGLSLYPAAPCRVLDTRQGKGAFNGTLSPPVDVLGSPCASSSQSQAYVFNATVVPQGSLGYLTLWPDGGQQPNVSTLNAYDGAITSNMAIVPAGKSGKVDAYADALTNLILDISGYFAP